MSAVKEPESWYSRVASLMLVERLDFLQACLVEGIPMSPADALKHQRRRSWRDAWEQQSRAYYEDKSSISAHSKSILKGKMLDNSERLTQAGKFKEAAEVLFQLAKVEGWVGAETSINFWDSLTGADITKLREKFAALKPVEPTVN